MAPYAGRSRVRRLTRKQRIPRWDFIAEARAQSYAIAIDPSSPSTVFIASPGRGVFRSDDAGMSWKLRGGASLRIADWGHEVRAVGDIAEAERAIDSQPPDVVLCDVVLPDGSGFGLWSCGRPRCRSHWRSSVW